MVSKNMISKVVLIALCIQAMDRAEATTSLSQQCSTAIQQVISCLTFATGKAAEPTKECCASVSSMKDKQPVCLCFFIGQAHNGSEQIKSLGIQEAKLMQLPTACQLKNASITNCPSLLGISPSSPAASIFMSSNASAPTGAASSSSSVVTTTGSNSSGFKQGSNGLLGCLLAVCVSVLLL